MAWLKRFKALILIGCASLAGCGPGPNIWRMGGNAAATADGTEIGRP